MPRSALGHSPHLPKDNTHRSIYFLSFMVLFWILFDGILSYATPLLITQRGFSNTWMGLIYGSSSVFGALFDFLISRFFKRPGFRRMFLIMFALGLVYPLILWQSTTLWMFLLAMAVWGIYWDLYGFGTFDFIGRYTDVSDHSRDFGILRVFRSLGNVMAPVIAGVLIARTITFNLFAFSWVFFCVSLAFFGLFLFSMRKSRPWDGHEAAPRKRGMLIELRLWKKIGKNILPALILTFYLFFMEAFFWTLTPILAESFQIREFGGFILAAYALPALASGWFVGRITRRFGKRRSAIVSLLIASLILIFFNQPQQLQWLVLLIFATGLFASISLPAVNGWYADRISRASEFESEIEGLGDMALNFGYIFGPIFAGFFADVFGVANAFSVLGLLGVVLSLFLLRLVPRMQGGS